MAKYRVPLTGIADAMITVETDETDPEKILEKAYQEEFSTLCAQCSGWGRDFYLEIGDYWEPVEKKDGTPRIYKED